MNRLGRMWKRLCRLSAGRRGYAPTKAAPADCSPPPDLSPDSPPAPWADESADGRLFRLAKWCLDGRLAAAELELHDWQRHADCPPQARVILTSLLARRGRLDHALIVARGAHAHDANRDRALAEVLIPVLVALDLTEAARRVAHQLFHRHGQEPGVAAWMQSMQPPGYEDLSPVADATVDRLAAELVAQPQVIPTLVTAQRVLPRPAELVLLRRAIHAAARELDGGESMRLVCEAMAELALLAQDADDARRWAHRGLKIQPYSATLALLLGRISDDPAVGPPAGEVLASAADAHPDYPDVQAALIRRRLLDGRADEARWRLARWMERQPDHPLVRALQQELAA
jgi:hypothetical protein